MDFNDDFHHRLHDLAVQSLNDDDAAADNDD